ncbi:MAG TPA: pantetheine-phosphate adenylyltransferase [Thermomicrobiales bacterium]|nr:pantetheine-phosphate adenylyltransferase [Thermomicrobiales bacterium]
MATSRRRVAAYPGTFDPITYGHIDIAARASQLFDEVIVAIYDGGEHAPKRPLFSADERVRLAQESLCHLDNVRVDTFSSLLVDYCATVGAGTIVRGLRAVSDFEYEFQLGHMYQHLNPDLEIVCLMARSDHTFISSSIIREVASLGGSVDELVPENVVQALTRRFKISD